jgi:hypothetical protein
MRSNVTDLATERRRRSVACGATASRSIEILAAQLPAFAAPRVMHQLALMLDDDCVELQFEPRATLIERLRFRASSDEFVGMLQITLDRAS